MSFFKGSPEDADHWDNEKLDNGGSDSDYDSNSIRTPLLRWRVCIPLLKTLSLSLILFVNLKYGASFLQFSGSKKMYANFCKNIGV